MVQNLAGKGYDFGGSKIRPEATGYGLIYFASLLSFLSFYDAAQD